MRKCYYATNSPGVHETEQRLKPFDLSQIPCGGQIDSVSTFIDGHYGEGLFGCSSVLDLMNVRANGEPADNDNEDQLASRFICSDHFDSLITNWNGSDDKLKNRRQSRLKYDFTALKCPLSHQKPASAEERRVVDKGMCIGYLKQEGVLIPPGTVVCKRHQSAMNEANKKFPRKAETGCDPSEQFPMDDADNNDGTGDLFDNLSVVDELDAVISNHVERTLPQEAVTALTQLVKSLGGDRVLTRGEWNGLSEETKRKKVYLTRKIFKTVCELISPDGKEELFDLAIAENRHQEDHKLADKIFNSIDERFSEATTAQEKTQVLSLISDLGLTLKETIRCVPSATLYYLNKAKRYNRGGMIQYMRKKLEEAMNPDDPSGLQYLLEYSQIPSEKQLTSLFTRLEKTRLAGPKKMNAKAAKVPKIKGIQKNSKKSTQSKSSVRSTKEGTRKKRVVVKESEDSDDALSEQDEIEDEGEIEYNEEHEDDFVRRVIQEDINELFL